ncbi:MAG: hypothetical protein LBI74_07955 [Synergistaceae bacterium]|jgi:hypothetical protein|nr:hypothetical protein [Synergistaceae bacterium]
MLFERHIKIALLVLGFILGDALIQIALANQPISHNVVLRINFQYIYPSPDKYPDSSRETCPVFDRKFVAPAIEKNIAINMLIRRNNQGIWGILSQSGFTANRTTFIPHQYIYLSRDRAPNDWAY